MPETNDRSTPYQIRMPSHQAAAKLRIGRRELLVQVRDVSWADITVALPASVARKFGNGRSVTLTHQGETLKSKICARHVGTDGETLLVLRQVHGELASSKMTKTHQHPDRIRPVSEQRVNSDPLLTIVLMVGGLVAIMIMPGWGDELGTSSTLTDGICDFCTGMLQFFKSLV